MPTHLSYGMAITVLPDSSMATFLNVNGVQGETIERVKT
jgi:hypothetical protein